MCVYISFLLFFVTLGVTFPHPRHLNRRRSFCATPVPPLVWFVPDTSTYQKLELIARLRFKTRSWFFVCYTITGVGLVPDTPTYQKLELIARFRFHPTDAPVCTVTLLGVHETLGIARVNLKLFNLKLGSNLVWKLRGSLVDSGWNGPRIKKGLERVRTREGRLALESVTRLRGHHLPSWASVQGCIGRVRAMWAHVGDEHRLLG